MLHAFAVRQSPIYEDSTFCNAASGTPPGATVVVTHGPKAFDQQGNYSNSSDPIFRAIATRLALRDAPPIRK